MNPTLFALRKAEAFISAYRNQQMTGTPTELPSDYEAITSVRAAIARLEGNPMKCPECNGPIGRALCRTCDSKGVVHDVDRYLGQDRG